ncbi:MAG: CoA pyrophosphatase [Bdellovibrionia bacterium]
MNPSQFEKQLREALSLDLHYAHRVHRDLTEFAKANATSASVLVLFGYSQIPSQVEHADSRLSLLYIRRTDAVETHKGQIAFPGGRTEPEEVNRPDITALRETEEEVGISRDKVTLFGQLPPLFTVTGYLIQPFVGILNQSISEVSLTLDPHETAEAIWTPLVSLLDPGAYQAQTYKVGNVHYPIDVYQYQHHRIWGATGSMTKNLLDRLHKVGNSLR